jgi:hypothetical protein
MRHRTFASRFVLVAAAVVAASCSSTPASRSISGEPEIDQPGRTISRYRGLELDVLVDYKYAAQSLGEPWLILNVAATGTQSKAVEIRADSVSVVTPDGRRVPLPDYEDFIGAYAEVQSAARRAALASDPLDFPYAGRRNCDLGFQPLPGTQAALKSKFVNFRTICQGLLFFPIEGGVQPGTWKLVIDLEEMSIQVPFTIEPPA